MNYVRRCKTCGKDISYKHEITYRRSLISNADCKTCSALKRTPKTEEVRNQISKTLTGRKTSDEIKHKISKSIKEKFNTIEYKQKFSILHKGENNGMFGKFHTNETKEKISEITKQKMSLPKTREKMLKSKHSIEYRKKLSNALKGRRFSSETKRKMRESVLRRVSKYGIHARNFNPLACKLIDEYGEKNGYNFQHALNGGEVFINGYSVDAYDREKNVVLEVDEKHHFNSNGCLKQKDIIRQKEIEGHIKCKFIRIPFTNQSDYL